MYLPDFVAAYGEKHIVIVNLRAAAGRFGVSMPTLYSWGVLVQKDWKERNKNALAAAVDWRSKIEQVELSVQEVKAQQQVLAQQLAGVQDTMQEVLTNQRVIVQLLHQMTLSGAGVPAQSQLQQLMTPSATDTTAARTPAASPVAVGETTLSAPVTVTAVQVPVSSDHSECAEVGVKRPRTAVSFLPAPPTTVRYDQPLATYDIVDLYHDALRPGIIVDCPSKQDRNRIRAVVDHARGLLMRSDAITKKIKDRLGLPPPPRSSPEWSLWKDQHMDACRELKEIVKKQLEPEGDWPAACSASVSAIGTRVQKVK